MNQVVNFLKNPLTKPILVYLILLIFFLFFGDKVGWEGDDVSQLEGIVNFQYKGYAGVYQYYWQPLAYQFSIFINNLIGNPKFLFLLPQIVGAANIALLMWSAHLFSEKKISLLLTFSFLLLLPELFFCGLYYQSTVFAMLPMSIALVFVSWKQSSPFLENIRSFIIGFSSIVAIFFRVEFVLCIPLIWYLIIFVGESKKVKIIPALFSSGLAVVLGLATGTLNLSEIVRTATGYSGTYQEQGLLFSQSVKIVFTTFNVTIWITLFSYLVFFVISRIKRKSWKSLLVFLPIIILLYPLTKLIFSPKYLVPGVIFLPLLLSSIAVEIQSRLGRAKFKKLSYLVVFISFLLQIVSIQPAKSFPYIVKSPPSYIGTYDGARPLGAYLYGYNRLRKTTTEGSSFTGIDFARKLANLVSDCKRDVTVIYLNKKDNQAISSWLWAWPSFYLQLKGYKVKVYHYQNEIVLTLDQKAVKMKIIEEKEFRNYKTEDLLIRVDVKEPFFEEKAASVRDIIQQASTCN